jgi:hypothetical protein
MQDIQETMQMDVETQGEPDNEEASSTGSKTKLKGPDNSRVAMTRRPEFWQPLRVGFNIFFLHKYLITDL